MPTLEVVTELTIQRVVETLNNMHWTVIPSFLSVPPERTDDYLVAVKGWAEAGNISPALLRVRVVSASLIDAGVLDVKFFVYPISGPGGMLCRYTINRDGVAVLTTYTRDRFIHNDFNTCVDAFACYCDEMPEEDGWAEDCAICDYGATLACREHGTIH